MVLINFIIEETGYIKLLRKKESKHDTGQIIFKDPIRFGYKIITIKTKT